MQHTRFFPVKSPVLASYICVFLIVQIDPASQTWCRLEHREVDVFWDQLVPSISGCSFKAAQSDSWQWQYEIFKWPKLCCIEPVAQLFHVCVMHELLQHPLCRLHWNEWELHKSTEKLVCNSHLSRWDLRKRISHRLMFLCCLTQRRVFRAVILCPSLVYCAQPLARVRACHVKSCVCLCAFEHFTPLGRCHWLKFKHLLRDGAVSWSELHTGNNFFVFLRHSLPFPLQQSLPKLSWAKREVVQLGLVSMRKTNKTYPPVLFKIYSHKDGLLSAYTTFNFKMKWSSPFKELGIIFWEEGRRWAIYQMPASFQRVPCKKPLEMKWFLHS